MADELNFIAIGLDPSHASMAEQIRRMLVLEQDHQIDLATALGEDVPDVSRPAKGRK